MKFLKSTLFLLTRGKKNVTYLTANTATQFAKTVNEWMKKENILQIKTV